MADDNRASTAPYEAALLKAFDKLTSQVLIFLLAYVIVLIGVAWFGDGIDSRLRMLFYLIPIMGVLAHVWLQRRRHIRRAMERDVYVGAGVTTGGSTVVGEGGRVSEQPGQTQVHSGYAGGRSTVAGRMTPEASSKDPVISQDFIETYHQLSRENRIKLLSDAQDLLENQEKPGA
jgi:hypothetical protein